MLRRARDWNAQQARQKQIVYLSFVIIPDLCVARVYLFS